MKMFVMAFALALSFDAVAASNLEGQWMTEDGQATVRLVEFDGLLTMNTRSYYYNGAPSDYFFSFRVPKNRDVQPGEILEGRLRSVDGFYGCLFEEPAKAQLTQEGRLKLHYPLLTFHRETRSVVDRGPGGYRRVVDWNGWGWVETVYHFPLERWRVISSECVIDARNWTTGVLVPVPSNGGGGPEFPVPRPQ
ncbi:hypothetical protein [Bdellovibrio sp. ArHS]|uniref:hypothetical protein n=1 Tax=Bdellovibrio sp. ArHS TaxID=1569284 RepID=UPI000AF10AB9|nr:hypothetical protein [Bdellovibrio sp. ArHS]